MASWRWNNCERNSTRPSREKRGSTASDHAAWDPSRPSGVVEPEGEAGLLLLQSLGSPPLSVHAIPNGVVLGAVQEQLPTLPLDRLRSLGEIPRKVGRSTWMAPYGTRTPGDETRDLTRGFGPEG